MLGTQRRQARKRKKWEAALSWFRVRYSDANRASKAFTLLSSAQAAGRVALRFAPANKATLATLCIGVESRFCPLLEQMASHFDFILTRADSAETTHRPLGAVRKLDWHSAFDAHLVNGCLFASNCADEDGPMLFPQIKDHNVLSYGLQLPLLPQPGISSTPVWPTAPTPTRLLNDISQEYWPLGYSAENQWLSIKGRVGVFGRNDTVAHWLVQQILAVIKTNPSNLIVIDGYGDLVPHLKRKTAVTQRLNSGISYIDLGGSALPTGFNPLSKVEGESNAARLHRWQSWFKSMHVHSDCHPLLAGAFEDNVDTLPELLAWLNNREHRTSQIPVASLQSAINHLMADSTVREWLDWPPENTTMFQGGAFLFCCTANTTARKNLLQSVLLAAIANPQHRIVLHGIPLHSADLEAIKNVVTSNYPAPNYAASVLVKGEGINTDPSVNLQLHHKDDQLQEIYRLLQMGEGLIITDSTPFFSTWNE